MHVMKKWNKIKLMDFKLIMMSFKILKLNMVSLKKKISYK